MITIKRSIALSLCLSLALALPARGALSEERGEPQRFLDETIMGTIGDAVFEAVVPKPADDPLTYEKPLPLDLLPYSIRTDKYYSVGTAFAIGPNQFVTAAHVTNLGTESQYPEFYLRDRNGGVYPVDRITKFSSNRDFAVFTLKGKTAKSFFRVNTEPHLNQRVYAVGNAFGEGIVIRDGLYTSNTPEEENGEWTWLRFSAAASPGNSGGPLLDREGRVIGVILRKSENENLNYALPISQVLNAAENKAVSHAKASYFLDNMDMTKIGTFDEEVSLPKSYSELNHDLITRFDRFSEKLLKQFFAENREGIFPRGSGSLYLLNKVYDAYFPHLIMKGEDGNWDAFAPQDRKRAELGNNGYVLYGSLARSVFLYLQKPDDVSLDTIYRDSKAFMDLILKGIYFSREVGSEKVKVVSLGKAYEDSVFVDSYGRKWMVRTWLLPYSDRKVVTFSLPVPGGCATVMRIGQTGQVNSGFLPDMKILSDFIYISYYGTFGQWREFLAMKKLLPTAFSAIEIVPDSRAFRYSSRRLSLACKTDVMNFTDKSDLGLGFSFFQDGGKVVWDVATIMVGEDKNTKTSFSVSRRNRPQKELGDSYLSDWDAMLNRKFPYSGSAFFKDGNTIIRTIARPSDDDKAGNDVLYTVTYVREGNAEQKEMESRLEKISGLISVREGAPDKKIVRKDD